MTHINPVKPTDDGKKIFLQPRWQTADARTCLRLWLIYTQSDLAIYRTGAWYNADGGVYQRNLANTIEPPMCGGDAAFYQIT